MHFCVTPPLVIPGQPEGLSPESIFTAEHAAGWIPRSRHPSRLLQTWAIHIAELG
jgi:hypothetical protein